MYNNSKIAIIGGGGWGTSLASHLASMGLDVAIFVKEEEVCNEINNNKTNNAFLHGIILSDNLKAYYKDFNFEDYSLIVNTVPTQFISSFYTTNGFKLKDKFLVNCSKGIEKVSHRLISEIFEKDFQLEKSNYAILTGPSHAELVARNKLTSVVAASTNENFAKYVQKIFSNKYFRVYTSNDTIGCEIGGALKNVIAIAAGINDGQQLGDNAKAALITRGLAEISRLGIAMGANPLTFSGLSGLGDLIVTCDSIHSRNRSVGERIGKGEKSSEILANMKMVAEGVHTSESAYSLGVKFNVEMPISTQIYKIIFFDKDPVEAIRDLMSRDFKEEIY